MEKAALQFDPIKYKNTTHDQWQTAAEAWYRWSPTLHQWLGKATERMLEMAWSSAGQKILDIAAGAGEQSITIAKKVCPSGAVLATDISSNILRYASILAEQVGISNIETKVMSLRKLIMAEVDSLARIVNHFFIGIYLRDVFPYSYTTADAINYFQTTQNDLLCHSRAVLTNSNLAGVISLTVQQDI